jgi:hypothetical protein
MSRCVYVNPLTGLPCLREADTGRRYCPGCHQRVDRECLAFEDWMEQVVFAMEAGYGLHPDDLPDCPYADWHASGLDAEEAARQAIALGAGDDQDA